MIKRQATTTTRDIRTAITMAGCTGALVCLITIVGAVRINNALTTEVNANDHVEPTRSEEVLITPRKSKEVTPEYTGFDNIKVRFKQVAVEEGAEHLIPLMLTQATLETGGGTSKFAVERNNYFGMNANTESPNDAFTYDTPEDSARDYIRRIREYYPNAYAEEEFEKQIEIVAPVYATDPAYKEKVLQIYAEVR